MNSQQAWEQGMAERAMRPGCECPTSNPDCEHPTCPRWPQPGHFAVRAAEVVEQWETGGEGYADLEQRIAVALAEAARAAYGQGRDDEADGLPVPTP